jgi:hypothetical protein
VLIINAFQPAVITALAVVVFISDNILLLTLIGSVLLLILAFLYTFRLKKKNKKQEAVRPITNIIGNVPERIAELNQEIKPFGFAYEPNQDVFYSRMNPWQRELGYCRLYDEASAAMSMIIDCEPVSFEYNGKKWLIEFWKGQYGMNTGGEIGIYYTTGPNLNIPGIFNGTFYYCVQDEDCISMSFVLRKNGNLLFTRSAYHWWLTGFKLGEFSKPSELTMDITLDLYDRRMTYTFVNALMKIGYKVGEFSVQGSKVFIHFGKPHSPQPVTRTAFTDFIMQRNNESFCKAYKRLTSDYTDTLDKLEILRRDSPVMYQQILTFGKPKDVYEAYDNIKNRLDKE